MSDEHIRVLLLIKGLGVGGAERLLERAIPYLDRRQFAYQVGYFLPWKKALRQSFEAADIPVHCFNFSGLAAAGILGRLATMLREERIDLVHAHLPVPAVMARLAKRRAGVRWVVYTEHNVPARYRLPTRTLNAVTYRLNDAVIAVSREVQARIQPYVRRGRPPLFTIPNAVDPDMFEGMVNTRDEICREFGFPPDALIVVNVANLVAKKGHRYLLAAAKRVVGCEPRARFLLVGTGPLGPQLSAEARRYGLNGQVVFTGFREDATRLMAAADVFVLSSLYEGLPVSLLEAMALGKSAVVTRVGGVPEVAVANETAVVVEAADEDALAAGILDLLRDPSRRLQIGASARGFVRQRYGMAQMVAAVEDVYRQVVAR